MRKDEPQRQGPASETGTGLKDRNRQKSQETAEEEYTDGLGTPVYVHPPVHPSVYTPCTALPALPSTHAEQSLSAHSGLER